MCQRYFICAFAPCVLFLFSQAAFPSETDQLLAGVKKIYLHNPLERDQMMALLSVELTQKGYAIAGDISEADAVLKGTHETEIIIDDSPHPKETNSERTHSKYVYELITRNNKRLWKTSFSLKGPMNEADKKASARIIDKMNNAIKSAIQKQENPKN